MGKSIGIDWNRFTLPNRNEKFRFSTTCSYNASATCITVLQDRVMASDILLPEFNKL